MLDNFDTSQLDPSTYELAIDRTAPLPRRTVCPGCKGAGHTPDGSCWGCGGTGWLALVREDGPEPCVTYFAFSGGELVETGGELVGFVGELLRSWEYPDDVAVWREREGEALRLVAVLYRDGRGNNAVRWL